MKLSYSHWAMIAVGIVLTGAIIAFGMLRTPSSESSGGTASSDPEILYWVAPMDPTYRRDEPGLSPMGMELVPVYAEDEAATEAGLRIDPAAANNIGVRTAMVQRTDFRETVRAVGYVSAVDDLASSVSVRAEGWIESLPVAAAGDRVEAGDVLFHFYSPQIATAQGEYLQAVRTGRSALASASRSRLDALGMSPGQIDALAARGHVGNRLAILSPRSGVVTDITVREGQFVRPGDPVMTIADLSEVWVQFNVFERQADIVELGQRVTIRATGQGERTRDGEVEYVYPTVDPQTRTVQVRTRLANPRGELRPGAFVEAEIAVQPRAGVLTVPRDAVIVTPESERVIVLTDDDRFFPAAVESGREAQGRVEILSGLEEGETIVVSGQFLLDSEANLRGAMLRMMPPGPIDMELASNEDRTDAPLAPPAMVMGVGRVESIMPGHGMITLAHEPIAALSWPAMQMSFSTTGDVPLDGIAHGDRVEFMLTRSGEDWLISAIEPAGETAETEEGEQ